MRDDCVLFLGLYIACQIRDGNTEDFFKYENQPWPPPLSQLCQLRGGQKADLALCLPSTSAEIATQPVADVVILDGTAIVQMLQPRTARTFDEYLSTVYAPYILKHLETARRADLIWDVYQSIFILFKVVSLKVLEGQSTYSIYDEGILSSTERTEMSLLAPCTHEEEDSGLTVHVFDTTSRGHR